MSVQNKLNTINETLESIRQALIKRGLIGEEEYPDISEYPRLVENCTGGNVQDLVNYIERRTDSGSGYTANGLTKFIGSYFSSDSFITRFIANDMTQLTMYNDRPYVTYMFSGCSNLENVELNNLQTLDTGSSSSGYVFYNCPKLRTISLDKLENIKVNNNSDWSLCYNLNALESLSLPSLKSITVGTGGYQRFYFIRGCSKLKEVQLSTAVSLNVPYLFYDLPELRTVDAPLLEEVGNNCFYNCPNIDTEDYSNIFPKIKKVGGSFINKKTITQLNMPTLEVITGDYFCYECTNLIRVNLPKLKEIRGYHSFNGNRLLTSLSLPSLIYLKANYAFINCHLLKNVNMPNLKELVFEHSYNYRNTYDATAFSGTLIESLDLPELVSITQIDGGDGGQSGAVFGNWSGSSSTSGRNKLMVLKMPKLQTISTGQALRSDNGGYGTKIKTGWNNFTANELTSITSMYYSPFYYESDLTWVDFPVLRELICTLSNNSTSSLFLNTGLKRFWLPKDTIQRIDAQTLNQAPFKGLSEEFEIWTDFESEDEINAANVVGGTLLFGSYWNNISEEVKATVCYGKTHDEYRAEVARLDGGEVKPEFT